MENIPRDNDIDALFQSAYHEVVNNELLVDTAEARNERMTQVISKFASALTARLVNVSMSDAHNNNNHQYHAEAWSDAENIWFSKDKVKDLTDIDTVLAVKGMALHEIGHILYTPRSSSNLLKWVNNNGYLMAFNILEDQRLELFLSAKYSNVKHWFTAAVMRQIINNPKEIPVAYPLVHGRAFLPADLVKLIKDAYIDQSIIAEISQIVDDYTILNLSNSAHIPIAMKLIERLNELLKLKSSEPQAPKGPDNNGGCGHTGAKSSEKSKTTNKAGQDRIIDKIVKSRNAKPADTNNGEQEGEGDIESDNITDISGTGKDAGNNDGNKPTDDGGDIPSTGSSKGSKVEDTIVSAKKHLNNVKNNLREELSDLVAQFNGDQQLTSKHIPKPLNSSWVKTMDVPTDVVLQVRSFANQLMLLKADYDPGWNRKVDVGRLNIQRYSTGVDADECFDQWDNGRDDVTDIEAVILLDTSGSMEWTKASAFDSTWAIKRALDKIDASTTVMTFDNDARILYSANERASSKKKVSGDSGGTEPKQALDYAKYLLANSERAIKLLIVITDGVWYNSKEQDKTIAQLRRSGVVTALGFIDYQNQYPPEQRGNNVTKIDGHNAEIVVPLDNGSSLLTLAKALVKVAIKRNLSK